MYRSSAERSQPQEALDKTCHVRQTEAPPSLGRCFATWVTHVVLLWISLPIALGWYPGAQAQEPFGTDQPQRPGPVAPPFPQEQPAPTLPRPELPPVPPVPPGAPKRLPLPRLLVRQIEVVGNTVFSNETLAEVAAAYVG